MRPLAPPSTVNETFTRDGFVAFLREVARHGASEVHFKVPSPPMIRVEGALHPFGARRLTPGDTQQLAALVAALAGKDPEREPVLEVELAFGVGQLGRFQAHLYPQRGSIAAVVRQVHATPPTLADLGAPPALRTAIGIPGLTVLAGPRAVAWLHAAVDDYNRRVDGLVVLAEQPLAWLHKDERAVIAHREVGVDVPDFATAVRSAWIVGADLVALGDVPDEATAEAVLLAVERGRSVLLALVTQDAGLAREQFLRALRGQAREDARARFDRALVETFDCPA